MDNSNSKMEPEEGNESARKRFFLGKNPVQLSTLIRDATPTPNSNFDSPERTTSQSPLLPQGSLLMIDENKQPSALEITLEDAPRVYQETDEEDD